MKRVQTDGLVKSWTDGGQQVSLKCWALLVYGILLYLSRLNIKTALFHFDSLLNSYDKFHFKYLLNFPGIIFISYCRKYLFEQIWISNDILRPHSLKSVHRLYKRLMYTLCNGWGDILFLQIVISLRCVKYRWTIIWTNLNPLSPWFHH